MLDGGEACGPLAIDSTSTATSANEDNLSWDHDTGTDDNRLLVVAVSLRPDMAVGSVTSVTYGGVSLAHIRSDEIQRLARAELWSLADPPSGSSLIEVTSPGARRVVAGAVTFTGVDPAKPLGEDAGSSGTLITPSVAISSAPGNIVLDTVAVGRGASSGLAVGPEQTLLWSSASGNSINGVSGGGSTKSGAESLTMSWTVNILAPWAISAVSIRPCQQGQTDPAAAD